MASLISTGNGWDGLRAAGGSGRQLRLTSSLGGNPNWWRR